MKIEIIGSTKPGYILPTSDALEFGAKFAGICYSQEDWADLDKEEIDKIKNRIKRTVNEGHHSVYGHPKYNFYFKGLPKILAMFLNNEKVYDTSEKSARYTQMIPENEKEIKLYNKWKGIFENQIKKVHPEVKKRRRQKLTMENARYLTSIFTPTKMGHTLGFGQLNYIMHFFKEFIANAENSDFNQRIKKSMAEFNQGTSAFYVPNLNPLIKARKLSLIAERQNFMQFFNECYSVNYELSLAGLAQAQRHRTLNYQIQPISGDEDVFIPPILLYDTKLSQSWKSDMEQVRKNFPQGLLAKVNERGTYEDFISKANERLCGQVQLEIMLRTKRTLMEYIAATKGVNNEVHDLLLPYNNGPKCTFPNIKCLSPCEFKKKTLERLI